MSLRSKFKSDPALSREGKWFYYPNEPNKDGSVPGVKLARISANNPRYMKLVKDLAEANNGKVPDDKDNELFVDAIIIDWANIQPNDDGVNLTFTRENALTLFSDPAWLDLRDDWRAKAIDIANFRAEQLEQIAGK